MPVSASQRPTNPGSWSNAYAEPAGKTGPNSVLSIDLLNACG
jgi:hypothetical protein